jgi:hypothetical protein
MVSAQILRNWSHGSSTIAAMEMLTSGLARLGTDLSLALPVRPPGSEDSKILFEGEERSSCSSPRPASAPETVASSC